MALAGIFVLYFLHPHLTFNNSRAYHLKTRRNIPSCKYFAVATTIFDPSPAVLQLLLDDSWCVIVVGDHKTNVSTWEAIHDHSLVFLSYTEQVTELGYTILEATPSNHFARKNIGYLFAIQHGAKLIYDFDDDNVLKSTPADLIGVGTQNILTWSECQHHLFNPYPIFEPKVENIPQFVWPRGLPLEFVHDNATWDLPSLISVDHSKVAVYQSLADIDPDVDAVYRMTRTLPITFTKTDQMLLVPEGSFAPWNAQATLFKPPAFGGLIMPVTVTGRVADIWRSYISTRLLWLAGFQVAFVSPLVNQYRNPHEYHTDFLAERDLYERSDAFVRTLIHMDTTKFMDLPDAYMQIIRFLVDQGFLGEADYALAKSWVQDLAMVGYVWPALKTHTYSLCAPRAPKLVDHRITDLPAPLSVLEIPEAEQRDTAICVSGQLRTLNLRPDDPDFPQAFQPMNTMLTAADMHGKTVAETIVSHLYPSMGRFDVYMSVSTLEGQYEPRVNDTSACESLRPLPPNRLFCEVIRQEELELISPAVWQNFFYPGQPVAYQGLLQQMHGQQRCARMIEQQRHVRYSYAVRLRPDMAILKTTPPIQVMLNNDTAMIKYVAPAHCCCGNEDAFGVGYFDTMMLYFNRIDALRTSFQNFLASQSHWTSELFLLEYMKRVHNVTLEPESGIVGCLVKPLHRTQYSQP